MILFLTSLARAKECAAALQRATKRKIELTASVSRAVALLQRSEYEALILDESLVEIDEITISTLLQHARLALPIYVNLGLHGTDRIVRHVTAGLLRHEAEKLGALRTAGDLLRSQLRGDVTGLLLTSELALRDPATTPGLHEKIRSMYQVAEHMRSRLELPMAP